MALFERLWKLEELSFNLQKRIAGTPFGFLAFLLTPVGLVLSPLSLIGLSLALLFGAIPRLVASLHSSLLPLFQFFAANMFSGSNITFRLVEHMQMTGTAMSIAIIIGVPLGIVISYIKPLNKPTLALTNLVQAIPSLAMLGFLVPILGIGARPAIFMVIVYSLLPIVKNTFAGLSNQNAEMIEAAKGIGMTQLQILFRIKLPLALPIIMAGIRISAVTSVGIVTIAAFIGAGGLGFIIHSGINMMNPNMVLAGAIPACILALTVDFVMSLVEKRVTPKCFRASK